MLKRECIIDQGVQKCQIPYSADWISGITELVGLVALLSFTGVAFFKLIHAFFK